MLSSALRSIINSPRPEGAVKTCHPSFSVCSLSTAELRRICRSLSSVCLPRKPVRLVRLGQQWLVGVRFISVFNFQP